ncbi:YbjN domain-containing protein, partial [Salmonella enterica subsp. enterica serovar Infantis]|nr:YbjN domain-containing protein [Salmonella enterica subsp. enterica serovar Isangi]
LLFNAEEDAQKTSAVDHFLH